MNRLRTHFIFANETSILLGTTCKSRKNFNRGKNFYELSKLPHKSPIFRKKSKIFDFSKKKFWWSHSTNRYLQNRLNQIFCPVTYLASRDRIRFCHIQGSENEVPPLTTPTGHCGRKFLCHNLGLGCTFKMRLYLPESVPDGLPPFFQILADLLLSVDSCSRTLIALNLNMSRKYNRFKKKG